MSDDHLLAARNAALACCDSIGPLEMNLAVRVGRAMMGHDPHELIETTRRDCAALRAVYDRWRHEVADQVHTTIERALVEAGEPAIMHVAGTPYSTWHYGVGRLVGSLMVALDLVAAETPDEVEQLRRVYENVRALAQAAPTVEEIDSRIRREHALAAVGVGGAHRQLTGTRRTARWFAEATRLADGDDAGLSPGRLRRAALDGRLHREKVGGQLHYGVADVCRLFPEWESRIQAALAHESARKRTKAHI